MEQPLTYWPAPSIAPSGFVFLNTDQPSNEADILLGALAGKHIHWLEMTDDKKTMATKSMEGYARFRDIELAPDGKLYALTEGPNQLISLTSNQMITSSTEENKATETTDLLFPNPSNDGASLKVDLNKTENVTIRIYTSDGILAQAPFTKEFSAGSYSIDLQADGLEKGMYQVELSKGNQKQILKWVKI